MELALILVVMVFVELVCTVWELARIKYDGRKYEKLERRITRLEKSFASCEPIENTTIEQVPNAEELAQASAILAALSGKKED